jgi:hypothetical protein
MDASDHPHDHGYTVAWMSWRAEPPPIARLCSKQRQRSMVYHRAM